MDLHWAEMSACSLEVFHGALNKRHCSKKCFFFVKALKKNYSCITKPLQNCFAVEFFFSWGVCWLRVRARHSLSVRRMYNFLWMFQKCSRMAALSKPHASQAIIVNVLWCCQVLVCHVCNVSICSLPCFIYVAVKRVKFYGSKLILHRPPPRVRYSDHTLSPVSVQGSYYFIPTPAALSPRAAVTFSESVKVRESHVNASCDQRVIYVCNTSAAPKRLLGGGEGWGVCGCNSFTPA